MTPVTVEATNKCHSSGSLGNLRQVGTGIPLCLTHEEDVCEVGIVELEMSLIVELEERGAVGVVVLEVHVVALRLARGMAALLAHIHLRATLLVGVAVLDAVHLQAVGLEGAALREGLLAQVAFVWAHT